MLYKNTFDKLDYFVKKEFEVQQQMYEDVPGFDSLRNIFICLTLNLFVQTRRVNDIYKYEKLSFELQTRTTYSCSNDEDEYDKNLLRSRPLPWVVRVLFESENSLKKTICSGRS